MSPYTASLSRHHLSTSRVMAIPRKSCHHLAHSTRAPVQLSGLRSSSFSSHADPAKSAWSLVPNQSGRLEAVVEQRWLDHFLCFSSASDVGLGGAGGNGGSGDGNSGGRVGGGGGGVGGESGDESNWSLIPWYLGLLAKYPVREKGITSAFLTFIGDLICQLVFDQVPFLDLKRIWGWF